jgi:hypothetical protein
MRVYIYNQLRSLQMTRNIQCKYREIRLFKLFKRKLKPSLVALTNLSVLGEHLGLFLFFKLFGVSLFLFSQLVFVHFFIHLLS